MYDRKLEVDKYSGKNLVYEFRGNSAKGIVKENLYSDFSEHNVKMNKKFLHEFDCYRMANEHGFHPVHQV